MGQTVCHIDTEQIGKGSCTVHMDMGDNWMLGKQGYGSFVFFSKPRS